MTTGTVARIAIAPVKALALVALDEADVRPTGVHGDRRYALLDAQHRLANGKRLGPLVRIRPEIDDDPETPRPALPGRAGDRRPGRAGRRRSARCSTATSGRPASSRGAYAEALSEAAGQPLTLVRMTEDGSGIDRADEGGSVSIQSSAGLRSMAEAAGLDAPLDGRRFRMTFTVDGVEAHAEDGWLGRPVRIGEAVVRPGGNIGRCAVTTQDPDTGIRSLDTLKLLAETRGHLPTTEPLPFGVGPRSSCRAASATGDPVEPLPAGWTRS